jgi:hypothetical protein
MNGLFCFMLVWDVLIDLDFANRRVCFQVYYPT